MSQGIEELRYSVLCTTLELKETIKLATEEIKSREDEILHIKDLLSRTIKERDEAKSKCQTLMLEKLKFQKQLNQNQEHIQVEEFPLETETEPKRRKYSNQEFGSSDTDHENINIASPNKDFDFSMLPPEALNLGEGKPLPEKGKLLEAVMEAGPLLHNLLLAGPLPQWQHPPPPLNSIEIPQVPSNVSPPKPSLLQQNSLFDTNSCFNSKR